ncbi:hypothetical protein EDC30_103201 [Paucimonas lemoignei]|uniref:PIN domain-containing protein n=1 Tax=Paucimonas lemoignei TaxID=29443 RepID=A0A4R3I204_PAULE|nr:hypothetical protein [Paucimonas lemoignei]TCS37909.1 hypothetical protein EDC30_103201 [Paucimonas lemoignei]
MTGALIDNDVLYKTAAFGVLGKMMASGPFRVQHYSMLGAAKYMITKRLTKRPPARGSSSALAEFEAAIAAISVLEPTDEEIRFAATLEFLAQELNLELDGGESILCAILLNRKSDYIFTGDKRAIRAVSGLLAQDNTLGLSEKIVCLEQIFMWLIQHADSTEVRTAICAEPTVDKSLANCFSCLSPTVQIESWREGLNSHIEDLKQRAPGVLATHN